MPRLKRMSLEPILFVLPTYEYMIKPFVQTANFSLGEFNLKRFPNNELHITLRTEVNKRNCFVLGTIAPFETNIFSFLLLCHTLKKEKVDKITAVLPYLAYSRHDKNEPKKSYATALIGQLFASAGITEVVTIDIHSLRAKRLFPLPIISLSPAKIFANEIINLSLQNATIVAPDEGAINRCKAAAKQAGIKHEIAYMEKKRTEQGVVHNKLYGTVNTRVIVIDDILDTGGTLVSCCEKLVEMGVKEITIMITHGWFTGNKWEQLWELGVKNIYCTDTVPLPPHVTNPKIIVLSIIPLLINKLRKI